jgi:hypothetical protein
MAETRKWLRHAGNSSDSLAKDSIRRTPVIDEPTFCAQSLNFLYAQFKAPSMTDSWCVCPITSNDHEPLIAHPGSMTQTVAFTEMIMGNPAAASPLRESRPPYWP